jgi:hypothetical protein
MGASGSGLDGRSGALISRRCIPAASVAILLIVGCLSGVGPQPAVERESSGSLQAAASGRPVELAPYMGEIQRLTHKLALSVAQSNYALADFYLRESLEAWTAIREHVPEYRGYSIALLVDQIIIPRYDGLESALEQGRRSADDRSGATKALEDVIAGCNHCHAVTHHGFIKITDGSDFNPFNQDFER